MADLGSMTATIGFGVKGLKESQATILTTLGRLEKNIGALTAIWETVSAASAKSAGKMVSENAKAQARIQADMRRTATVNEELQARMHIARIQANTKVEIETIRAKAKMEAIAASQSKAVEDRKYKEQLQAQRKAEALLKQKAAIEKREREKEVAIVRQVEQQKLAEIAKAKKQEMAIAKGQWNAYQKRLAEEQKFRQQEKKLRDKATADAIKAEEKKVAATQKAHQQMVNSAIAAEQKRLKIAEAARARETAAAEKAAAAQAAIMAAPFALFQKNMIASISMFSQRMRTFGYLASASLTMPLVMFAKSAVQAARDYEFTIQKIVGLTGESQASVNSFKGEIIELSKTLGKKPTELAEALYFISSSGLKGAEAMQVLKLSAKAAASGMGETQTMANYLTSVLNAYRGTGLTAAYATDVLVAGVREGKAEAEGFAAAMGSVAPLAAKLGMSIDQVAGSMAAVTLTGSTAAQSATYLRGMLNVLLKETVKGGKALESAGKKIDGLGVSYADLRDILREGGLVALMKKMDELTKAYGETLVSKVFPNIRAMLEILSLTGNNMAYNTELMKRITNSSGSLAKAFAAVSDTMKMKMDRALASINISMIELGTTMATIFIPILENIANGIQKLMAWFKSLDESQQKHVLSLLKWAALLGPMSMAISLLGYTLTGLMNIVNGVGMAFIKFSTILTFTTKQMSWAAIKASAFGVNMIKLGTAFKTIGVALLTNPWGLAIVALSTLIVVTAKALKKIKELNKEINTGGSVKYAMVEGILSSAEKADAALNNIRDTMKTFETWGMETQGVEGAVVDYNKLGEALKNTGIYSKEAGKIIGQFSGETLRRIQIDIDDTIDAYKVKQQELAAIGQKEIDADTYRIQLQARVSKIAQRLAEEQSRYAEEEAKKMPRINFMRLVYIKKYEEALRSAQAAVIEHSQNIKTTVSVEKASYEEKLKILEDYKKRVQKLLIPFSLEEIDKQITKSDALTEIFDQLEKGEEQIRNMKELTGGKGYDAAAAYASLYSSALQDVAKWTGLAADDERIKELLANWKKFGGQLKGTGVDMDDLTTKANELNLQLKYLNERSAAYTGYDENFNIDKEKLKIYEGVRDMFEKGVADAMKTGTKEAWVAEFNAKVGKELFKDAVPVGFEATLTAIINLLHETANAANIGDRIQQDFKQAEKIYEDYKQNLESMAKLRELKPPGIDLDRKELEFYQSTLDKIMDNYAAVYNYFQTTEGLGIEKLAELISLVTEKVNQLSTAVSNTEMQTMMKLLNEEAKSYDTVSGKLEVYNEQLQLMEKLARETRKDIIAGTVKDDGSLKKMTDEILKLKTTITSLQNYESVKYLSDMNKVLHGAATGASLFSGLISALENDLQLLSSSTGTTTEEFKQLAWTITGLKAAEQATSIISDSFIQLFDAIIEGAENMGEVLQNIFKNIAKQIVGTLIRILVQQAILAPFENLITGLLDKWKKTGDTMVDITAIATSKALGQAKAYEALTSAVAGAAAMPYPISMFAIPSAAAMVTGTLASSTAIISGLMSQAVKMKKGGVVPEGYPNDTFPALLSSGEVVVPEDKYKTAEETHKIYREYLDSPRMIDRPPRIPHMAAGGIVPPGYSNDTFLTYLSSGEAVIPLGNDKTGWNIIKQLEELIKVTAENKFADDPIIKAMVTAEDNWNKYYLAREKYYQTLEELNPEIDIDPSQYFKVKDLEGDKAGIRNGTIVNKQILADLSRAAAKENVPLLDALTVAMRESGIGHSQAKYGTDYQPQYVMQSWGSDFLKGIPASWDQYRMQNNLVNQENIVKGSRGYSIAETEDGYKAALTYGKKYFDYITSFEIDPTLFEPFRKEMRFLKQNFGQAYNPKETQRAERLAKDREVVLKNQDLYNFADSVYRANQPNIAMGGKGMPMMTGVMNKGISLFTKFLNKSKENVPAIPTITMLPEVVVTAERTKPDYTGMGIGFMNQSKWTGAKIGQAATETQYAKEAKDRINLWKQEADARHNFISDIGTNVATLATQFRFAKPEELEAGRGWEGRGPATLKAGTWGLANELTGGIMVRLGKTFAQGLTPLVQTFEPLKKIPGLLTAENMSAGLYGGIAEKGNSLIKPSISTSKQLYKQIGKEPERPLFSHELKLLQNELDKQGILDVQKTWNVPGKKRIRERLYPHTYDVLDHFKEVFDPKWKSSQLNEFDRQQDYLKNTVGKYKVAEKGYPHRFGQLADVNRHETWGMYLGYPQMTGENQLYNMSPLSTNKKPVYTINPNRFNTPLNTPENYYSHMKPMSGVEALMSQFQDWFEFPELHSSSIKMISEESKKIRPNLPDAVIPKVADPMFGTMGGHSWNATKLPNKNLQFVANDIWDLQPFTKRNDDLIRLPKIIQTLLKPKFVQNLEVGSALKIGKPLDVKVGFELDPTTQDIVKIFSAGGLTAGGLALEGQAKAQAPLTPYEMTGYTAFAPSSNLGQENGLVTSQGIIDQFNASVTRLGVVSERLDVASGNLSVTSGNIEGVQFPMTSTFTSQLGGVTPGFHAASLDIPAFGIPKPKGLSLGFTTITEGINESNNALLNYYKTMSDSEKATAGLEGVASMFGTLSGATKGAASGWLSFAGTVVGTIPQIITGLAALTMAHRAKQQAAAGDAVAEAAAGSMALGPVLGIIMLVASVAAIIAAMASIPKMAKGGIIPPGYNNDTFPALLSSNEAVIPLDRFENMSSGLEGDVRFVIEQDKLVGILAKANKKNKIY